MAIRQFDVLENPIARARRALPFVAVLQSDLADTGHDRVVAPLRSVHVAEEDYALLVPSLTALPVTDLRKVIANLAGERARILAALDYLFIGF